MNQNEKLEIINQLKDRFQKSSSVICVGFDKFTVEKTTNFRREIQQASGEYQVVKNTLAKRSVQDTPFEGLSKFFVNPTGVVFCPSDDIAGLAKVVTKFAAESEQQDGKGIKIKGGIVEGSVLDAAGIRKVSTLPPRQELLAQLVASLESPISGLVGALQGVINEFVYTLQAVADKKAEAQ